MKNAYSHTQGGQVFDLAIGETATVQLADGKTRSIKLLSLQEPRCSARGTIRAPRITIDVDGIRAEVPAAEYQMPQVVNGVKVACSVTRGVVGAVGSAYGNVYAMDKDARIRCWAPEAPLFGPKPMIYPARQTWFASMTQMANERCYVDAGELTVLRPGEHIYHHDGLDLGGHDRAVPIVAACAGLVMVRGQTKMEDYDGHGGANRYDRVIVRDDHGWYFLYAHLDMIAPDIQIGKRVGAGEAIGFLGKEGTSGGWAHLHFGIYSPQPNGQYGSVEGYPFLVEAYLHAHPGALLACARPHQVSVVGKPVELDGSRSICDKASIQSYRWTLHDGTIRNELRTPITYTREGMYSEMLSVTDDRGKTDVDFCVVMILPPDGNPALTPPSMQLTAYPTENLAPGQPVAFKVRTFFGAGPFAQNFGGQEDWDFGDGHTATTCSGAPPQTPDSTRTDFAERWHAYDKPGRYIVTVRRTGKNGITATAQIKVNV